ncbi:MAG: gamma-glutamyl-gamma-aminobutyrate hydrolase family protein [Chryseosolibacter sp.]
MKKRITIGITDCSRYENYQKWIEAERDVTVVRLSPQENNLDDIGKCDGIVLSGGEDVHPRFYRKTEYVERCHEIDEQRDEFEWKVLEHTEKNQIPVLGICRGLQVANVFFGGTLLPHIPDYGKFDHSKSGTEDRYHAVLVDPNSQLGKIVESTGGEINSAHHQAADLIGKGLVANALSPDGVVEGIEREGNEKGAFLMLVQWHPERMRTQESLFSKNIKLKFLEAVRNS